MYVSALHAEWLKIRTLRSQLVALAAILLTTLAFSALAGLDASGDDPLFSAYFGVTFGQVAAVSFGTNAMAAEFRDGALRTSLAAVPDRTRWFTAKVTAIAVPVLAVGLLTGTVTLLTGDGVGWAEGIRGAVGCGIYLTLMAAGFAAGLTAVLSTGQMDAWGWRVPFVFGLLIGPVGYFVRRYVEDSPAVVREPQAKSPMVTVFRDHWRGLLIAGGLLVVSTAVNFMLQYLPTYGIDELGLDDSLSFTALLIAGVVLTFVTPVVGLLGDRYGRLRLMVPAALLLGVSAVPLFLWLTASPTFLTLALCTTILGLLKSVYFGTLPSVMADTFPPHARATGLSFSYNTTVAIFGGFTPTIAAALIQTTGSGVAPGYYLLSTALLSVAALGAAVRVGGIR